MVPLHPAVGRCWGVRTGPDRRLNWSLDARSTPSGRPPRSRRSCQISGQRVSCTMPCESTECVSGAPGQIGTREWGQWFGEDCETNSASRRLSSARSNRAGAKKRRKGGKGARETRLLYWVLRRTRTGTFRSRFVDGEEFEFLGDKRRRLDKAKNEDGPRRWVIHIPNTRRIYTHEKADHFFVKMYTTNTQFMSPSTSYHQIQKRNAYEDGSRTHFPPPAAAAGQGTGPSPCRRTGSSVRWGGIMRLESPKLRKR